MHRYHEHRRHAHDRLRPRLRWRWLLPWVLLAYAATGVYSVRPGEQAVVRRFGRPLARLRQPGLHVGLPWGLDRVDRIEMLKTQTVAIGAALSQAATGRPIDPLAAECLSGDRNLVQAPAVVQYRVADPQAYLFHIAEIERLIENVAGGQLTTAVAAMTVDQVMTDQRVAIQDRVQRTTQQAADAFGAGVTITSVALGDVGPPAEVAAAFRDVTDARNDQQQAANRAEQYAAGLLARTRGEAQRVVLQAEGEAETIVRQAEGRADRFVKVLAGLPAQRELTERRLILETMEQVLPRLKKVVVDRQLDAGLDLDIVEETP